MGSRRRFRFCWATLVLWGGLWHALAAEEPQQWQTFAGYAPDGYGRHLVFVSGDEEYRSEEALTQLAKIMALHHGFRCTVLYAQDPEVPGVVNPQVLNHIPGLEALRTADLMVIATRFRALPDEQMNEIETYLKSGRPVVGLRTANHGFRFPEDSKWHHWSWKYRGEKTEWEEGFGGLVLGSWFFSHHGWHGKESTRGIPERGAAGNEILRGIEEGSVWGASDVYGVKEPIPGDEVQILLRGQVLAGMDPESTPVGQGPYEKAPSYVSEGSNDKNDPMQALAWTKSYQLPGGRKGRVFSTTLGASVDLKAEGTRRLLANGIFWCLGMEVPAETEVDLVDDYDPSPFQTHPREYWEERQRKVSDFDLRTPLYESVDQVQGEVAIPYFDVRGGREGFGFDFAGHAANRFRLYDYYGRQAEHYLDATEKPVLLPPFPGLDAGLFGHWGLVHKNNFKDRRWNLMENGEVVCGILRVDGQTFPRAIAIRLTDDLSCAFDTATLRYTHLWKGGFVKYSPSRWGIGHGIEPDGKLVASDLTDAREGDFLGYERVGATVALRFRTPDGEFVSVPEVEESGAFAEAISPEALADRARSGPARYADRPITLGGTVGEPIPGSSFAIDRIPVPLHNEFGSVMLIGGHDFFANGDAAVCTMFGDVWRVSGLDAKLQEVCWTRIATGLSQSLGLCIHEDQVYVIGRDRITRLHDLNEDGEIDYYENFCDDFPSSEGGHDFYTGLQRDGNGYFYFVAANSGVIRVAPDGSSAEPIATGLRNTNGVGASPDGSVVTTSTNEGDWTPASAVFEVRDGDFYGRYFNQDTPEIAPAMCYLPRGLDNSSGGQVFCDSKTWEHLQGQLFHFSFGVGTWMMILRDTEEGRRTQGAAVPLPGDFESGAHRGRFHPVDGHLYITGADGWGNYAITDGSFARVRLVEGEPRLPTGWKAFRNGILIELGQPVDPASLRPESLFAQTWNYEYADSYGSLEYSVKQPDLPGHDPVPVKSVHSIGEDGRTIFVEMPEMTPAMQMQVFGRLKWADGSDLRLDLYPTVLWLREDFTEFEGYAPSPPEKPEELSLRVAIPHPFQPKHPPEKQGRRIPVTAISGLQYDVKELRAKAGELISLEFRNLDTIPHNLVLVAPGRKEAVGLASNTMLTDPEAAARHYVPESDDVLHYTPMLRHNRRYSLRIKAPEEPGDYPFLCTYPGHWAVMNGVLVVEEK